MLFAQILNGDLGCASYLVGCEEAQEAVVVDPPYAIEEVLAEAERLDVRLVRTIETHTHADHLAGHGRLALEHDVPVSIHPAAEVDYPHDALADGAEITVGNVTADACQAACKLRGDCKAWTWVPSGVQGPGSRCWLKGSVPWSVPAPSMVSGTRAHTSS